MKPLIPILSAVLNTRDRREIDPTSIDGWYKQSYNTTNTASNARQLRIWINEFTKGRFYLSGFNVAFEDEEDFVIFKLWYKDEII